MIRSTLEKMEQGETISIGEFTVSCYLGAKDGYLFSVDLGEMNIAFGTLDEVVGRIQTNLAISKKLIAVFEPKGASIYDAG